MQRTTTISCCLNAKTSQGHAPVGACKAGACSYTATSTDCAFGCDPATGLWSINGQGGYGRSFSLTGWRRRLGSAVPSDQQQADGDLATFTDQNIVGTTGGR